jgi:PAS domain S-box-containing protein
MMILSYTEEMHPEVRKVKLLEAPRRWKLVILAIAVTLVCAAFLSAPEWWYRGLLIIMFLPIAVTSFFWGPAAAGLATVVLLPLIFFGLPPAVNRPELSLLALEKPGIHLLLTATVAGITTGVFTLLRRLIRDITRKERFYRTITDHTYDSEYWIDPEGNLLYQSPSIERITGYPPEFFFARRSRFVEIIHPEDRDAFLRIFVESISESDLPVAYQFRVICENGEVRWLETISKKIFDDSGRYLGKRGVTRDITRRKTVRQALEESERNLRAIVDNAKSVIVKYDMSGRITFFNKYAQSLFGYSEEEVLGRKGVETINKPLDPADSPKIEAMLDEILKHTEEYAYNENENYRQDGTVLWVAWTNAPLYDSEGKKTGILCIGNDKSRQKQAEDLLKQSLKEKEILLQEIHHRVKNNLQVISSLLNLQGDYSGSMDFNEVLRNCENRITSIALVHEQIYQTENLASVEMPSYIRSLLYTLFDSYNIDPRRVSFSVEVEEIGLHIDVAVPLGLILSELVSNSLKHAFPGEKEGSVFIRLRRTPEIIHIEVADDGIGIPDQDTRNGTLGLTLVDALCKQISCTLSVSSGRGTRWTLELPQPSPERSFS